MVMCGLHRMLPSGASALIVALPILVAIGLGTVALAADSPRPLYDWERPVQEPEPRKPLAPIRKTPHPTLAPSDRERWKKPVPQQHDIKIDKPQAIRLPKPVDPNLPKVEAPVTQDISEAGPVVVGRVVFRGPVPPPAQMEVTRDVEVCGPVVNIIPLSVDPTSHGVRNAIVHIGVGQEITDDVPLQVSVVKNKQCAFYPRVAALRAGAVAEISNDDPLMHNTNMTISTRTVLNVALVAGGNPIRKPLKKEGLHLIKCNVHKFMEAYRYVFSDPFFDQTNEAGHFRIAGLPPGLHAVSVWHETLGVLHKEIQVPVRGTVTVDFEFK
jgi:plastocyanin